MVSQEIIFPVLILITIFCVGVYLILRPYRKAKILINKWASDNNFEVIKKERKIGFDTGPFIFGGWTAIYKVVVKEPEGRIKTLYTKTGAYFGPFLIILL